MEYKTPKEILKKIPQNLANGDGGVKWKDLEPTECDIIYTTPKKEITQYNSQTYIMVKEGETEFVTKDFKELLRASLGYEEDKEYIDFVLILHDEDIKIDNFYGELCFKINDGERCNFLYPEDYELFNKYTIQLDLDRDFIFAKAKWKR